MRITIHNLVEDLAYQLKIVVCFQQICEVDLFSWRYHSTAHAKGVGYNEDLFFAEVISKWKGEHEESVLSGLVYDFCYVDLEALHL